MAIYSQLSIAKKRIIGYLQSTVNSQKPYKWLSTIRVVINRLKIRKLYKYKVVFLFIMLKGWYIILSDILAYFVFGLNKIVTVFWSCRNVSKIKEYL